MVGERISSTPQTPRGQDNNAAIGHNEGNAHTPLNIPACEHKETKEELRKRKALECSPSGESPEHKLQKHDNGSDDTNEMQYDDDVGDAVQINEPLLAYLAFALQSGTVENAKRAVNGYFTSEQILKSKIILWDSACVATLGDKIKRKSTKIRSEADANLMDMIDAFQKLDRADKMPHITISALDLGKIPRSLPEELNSISIVDRLAKLESKVSLMEDTVVKNVTDIHRLEVDVRDKKDNPDPVSSDNKWKDMVVEKWDDTAWTKSDGTVHEKTVQDVRPEDSTNYKQCETGCKSYLEVTNHGIGLTSTRGRWPSRRPTRGRGGSTLHTARSAVGNPDVLRLRGSNLSLDRGSTASEGGSCTSGGEGYHLQ
jgi:hypothetical protein